MEEAISHPKTEAQAQAADLALNSTDPAVVLCWASGVLSESLGHRYAQSTGHVVCSQEAKVHTKLSGSSGGAQGCYWRHQQYRRVRLAPHEPYLHRCAASDHT